MHVLLIADGRSPHTRGWIRGLCSIGVETTLLSSRRLLDDDRDALAALLPAHAVHEPADLWNTIRPALAALRPPARAGAAPGLGGGEAGAGGTGGAETRCGPPPPPGLGQRLKEAADLRAARSLGRSMTRLVASAAPDVVHALRIQYEAIAASSAGAGIPLAVSTWGSDLITNAHVSRTVHARTRRALERADAFFGDCARDAALADDFGLRPGTPKHVVPGNFGLDFDTFPAADPGYLTTYGLTAGRLVTYPRGVRSCIDHEALVQAFGMLMARGVDARFLAAGLHGVIDDARQVPGVFACTPALDHADMLRIAALSTVTVSPSTSDGTPNSILEGLAGGSVPVCGDLASLREIESRGAVMVWCDPADPRSIAEGVEAALRLADDPDVPACNRAVARRHFGFTATQETVRQAYAALVTTETTVES
ncbi:glycosyltransferase [Krasilnikovia sp. MM14-A1259]|uniref:glycosyltransferase n=1 Tax=Krasilnikovia sp. MM14-A1259 TaxID=3373539 RepID=UPI00399C7C63